MSTDDPRRSPDEVAEEVAPAGVKRARDGRRMNPRSLANLQPGAGAGRPGQAPALKHGARTHSPQRSPDWSPAVAETIRVLEDGLGFGLPRNDAGDLMLGRGEVEVVAVVRVGMVRVERAVADAEARGKMTAELAALQVSTGRKYQLSLADAMTTLRSQLDAGLVLALTKRADPAAVLSDPDPLARREGMRAMGLTVDSTAEEETS